MFYMLLIPQSGSLKSPDNALLYESLRCLFSESTGQKFDESFGCFNEVLLVLRF